NLASLTPGSFTFNVAYFGGTPTVNTPVTYTVATFPGGITGFNANEFSVTGQFVGTPVVGLSGNNLTLTLTPVPEPATYLLLASAGLAGAAGWWRRRRTAVSG